jgi:hypothetical protein
MMLCPECFRVVSVWRDASQELAKQTSVLTAVATSNDHRGFDEQAAIVEGARLAAENARSLVQLHRDTHRSVPVDASR